MMYSYAKSLLEQIDEAVLNAWDERETELRAEFDRIKDAAVEDAKARLIRGENMVAKRLSNGQDVPSTLRDEIEEFLGKVGVDVPAAPQTDDGTDPVQPSIVDPPLAANPANLTAGDGSAPVKTPPVVTPVQDNGVATVVAPSAPEGDKSAPAPTVVLDAAQVPAEPVTPGTAPAPVTPAASVDQSVDAGAHEAPDTADTTPGK